MATEGSQECHPLNQAAIDAHPVQHVVLHASPKGVSTIYQPFRHELKSCEEAQTPCGLVSDVRFVITIKEEPIDVEDSKFFRRVVKEDIHEEGLPLPLMQAECKKAIIHSRKRLRCSACSASFLHGRYGVGLEMLVGHIYTKHTRLKVSCLLSARRSYSTIIRDAVEQGFLPPCSGLVLCAE